MARRAIRLWCSAAGVVALLHGGCERRPEVTEKATAEAGRPAVPPVRPPEAEPPASRSARVPAGVPEAATSLPGSVADEQVRPSAQTAAREPTGGRVPESTLPSAGEEPPGRPVAESDAPSEGEERPPVDVVKDVAGRIEGRYVTCRQVAVFSGTILELEGGRFRYWFYTDVRRIGEKKPRYPLQGTYTVQADRLTLVHERDIQSEWSFDVIRGVRVLWRDDGLSLWRREKRVHPYAVLIHTGDAPAKKERWQRTARPSVKVLYDEEMIQREKREYEGRYKDQPEPVRTLLRARSLRGDADMSTYTAEVRRARSLMNPELPKQLVSLMGFKSHYSIDANSILEDLYFQTWLIKDQPPFVNSKEDRLRALGMLVDALSLAKERSALEKALVVFLRASGVNRIKLDVPGAGVRVLISYGVYGRGSCSYASGTLPGSGVRPKTSDWRGEMWLVSYACQLWCRRQLREQASRSADE